MTGQPFQWDEAAVNTLRARYRIDGPTRLAKALGTSRMSVVSKARHLGILPKTANAPHHQWTADEEARLRQLYPTADRQTLEAELGLPYHVLQRAARRLKLLNTTRLERSARTRAERNTSVDIHYFDQWSPAMAYVLGFLFADGSVSSTLGSVVIGISSKDVAVLDYIREQTKCTREYYRTEAHTDTTGWHHKHATYLYLGSVVMVRRLLELGLKPRKTYNDDPFPDVPDEVMPHFVRGYFDGDGTAFIDKDGYGHVSFVGSPKLITGLRDALVQLAGMTPAPVVLETFKTTVARISWRTLADLGKFRAFVYPEGYAFCLERKKAKIDEGLAREVLCRAFTPDEEAQVRNLYHLVGPTKLAELLGRSCGVIRQKARQLGLNIPTEKERRT